MKFIIVKLNKYSYKQLLTTLTTYTRKTERTFGFLNIPLGSLVTNQPSRHPGTIHLFDKDPRVRTGTIEPKTPIGTNGLLPKARWP